MKKRISALFTALLMTLCLSLPTLAANGTMEYVIDSVDLLTYEEWETLEDQAAELSRNHGCGIYIQLLSDYTDYGYSSVYETAESLYHQDGFGVGEGHDGILLLVSFETRDYALYTYGETAGLAFGVDAIAVLEDSFLPYLSEDDWYGGFGAYLTACDEALIRAETVESTEPASPVRGVLTVVGISCIVSLLVCLTLKARMKTVHHKAEARQYTANGGLQLTQQYDRYTHTTQSRRRIEKKPSSGGGGGGSGKF